VQPAVDALNDAGARAMGQTSLLDRFAALPSPELTFWEPFLVKISCFFS
jgi:hypothetical protein